MREEIDPSDQELYKIALTVENDQLLNTEMEDWKVTIFDGLEDI